MLPVLPQALIAVLGVIATLLAAVQPVLPTPLQAVVTVVLGICSALGIWRAHAAIRADLHANARVASAAAGVPVFVPDIVSSLPASVVAVLGFLATTLAAAAPSLGSPWREVLTAALALGTWLGLWQARAAIRAGRAHVRALTRAATLRASGGAA